MKRLLDIGLAPFYLYILGSLAFLSIAVKSLDPVSLFGSAMFLAGSLVTIWLKVRRCGE